MGSAPRWRGPQEASAGDRDSSDLQRLGFAPRWRKGQNEAFR